MRNRCMPARILITGATGTVGGALLRKLATARKEGKVTVVAGARSAAKRERLAALPGADRCIECVRPPRDGIARQP